MSVCLRQTIFSQSFVESAAALSTIFFWFAVVYDPASFYGHHEFDLAIAGMFGGFSAQFYNAYHQLIPQAPGFAARHKLYLLFHYLNHWCAVQCVCVCVCVCVCACVCVRACVVYFHYIGGHTTSLQLLSFFTLRNHFGGGYRAKSVLLMKDLVKNS